MGNRAVLEFQWADGLSLYLHWNGGVDSVEAFLRCAKVLKIGSGAYGVARFTQMVGNFMGGTMSVGLQGVDVADCDNGDNGTYVIDTKTWSIVDRFFVPSGVPEPNELEIADMFCQVYACNVDVFQNHRARFIIEDRREEAIEEWHKFERDESKERNNVG
jgi:hypothetical protein